MSDDKVADKITRQKDGEFDDPKERQEVRYVVGRVLFESIDKKTFDDAHSKIEALWWALGWIPATARSWKAMLAAGALAVFIGGQGLINNVSKFLGGFLP